MENYVLVQTVTGPIRSEQLGITLMHEHLFIDIVGLWNKPTDEAKLKLAHQPISLEMIGELRYDPFSNLDNLKIENEEAATLELLKFKELGGCTIVDVSSRYIGRNPKALLSIARRTGLNIIMGCGYYVEYSYPSKLKTMPIDAVVEELILEITDGVDGTGIKPGIIGEVGVSKDMTAQEIRMLRAQARAQTKTGLPLTIHLHGWGRQAHAILDIVAEEGVDLKKVILDHMNPSFWDLEYQMSLAERGAYLEYDQIGMDYYYPNFNEQNPSDEDNATAIKRLIDSGFINNILISQDVFLKMMLTRYGGFGYSHILKNFLPRLKRHGVTEQEIETLLRINPRKVFEEI